MAPHPLDPPAPERRRLTHPLDAGSFEDHLDPHVRFRLLGRLEVVVDGRDVAPTAPRTLQLLALLLLGWRHVVPADAIAQELWGDRPPRRARSSVQTHVHQLRQCLVRLGLTTDPDRVLVTRAPGYRLEVDPRRTDLHEFVLRRRDGLHALDEKRPAEAARCFREAEALWAGPPLANVARGPVLSGEAVELLERRRAVRSARIDADMMCGRDRDLVGELQSLCLAHPLDEVVHAQLVRVLGRCGRRADAMTVYRRLRDALDADLGVSPSAEVEEAYAELIRVRQAG
ncbi:AfsR/SARP family transcriptional regulator [Actinomycetospora atypica]|uniref:BTAD domain-containing putative transcriptional regulator n=1 Tax=Actinomycetospora atypica TaxID=1290095 RepID=A0ABV9YMV4_9PSEU